MNFVNKPHKKDWIQYTQRPIINQTKLLGQVNKIFKDIQHHGDKALKKYSKLYDHLNIENFKISNNQLKNAYKSLNTPLIHAIQQAKCNIEKFHLAQIEKKNIIETTAGVTCWRESRAIDNVGFYIPGGTAPLFSTILMLGIPAQIANCKQIILCTPPNSSGTINPIILYTAHVVGIKNVFAIGGMQAIGAMTFGTESIPKVDKIFGPGNQYVTAAKQLALNYGVAIDMPAGPSELLIIADDTANPDFIAADLLSQAEHGPDSQVILVSNHKNIISQTMKSISQQLKNLPRHAIAENALKNSRALYLSSIEDCIEFSNLYAPEHLILALKNHRQHANNITNAGSVFLGNYSCESAGDYASGPNHTLPTNGFARNYSGVSLDSFVKKITFQNLTRAGLKNISKSIEMMAEAEQLMAHKNAVSIRLKK